MRKTTIIILAVLSLTVSIFAWYPDSEIMCHVVTESMPADAVYVDMLIPIPETDEEYTGFNDSNGEKFGISHDSHIVQYNNGGFYSYTFHVTNAHSEIKPFDTGDGWYYVRFLDSYYGSFDDFRKEYRRAKFAYLDASGKVIATTNEIDIWQDSESVNMQITVSGEKATCEISTNKAGMLWGIVFIVAGIIIFVLLPLNIIFWSVVALIFLFKFIKKKTSLRK